MHTFLYEITFSKVTGGAKILQAIVQKNSIHPRDEIRAAIGQFAREPIKLTKKQATKEQLGKEEFSKLEEELLKEKVQISKSKLKSAKEKKTLDETLDTEEETESEDTSEELLLPDVDYSMLERQFVIDKSFYGARKGSYLEFAAAQIEDAYEAMREEEQEYRLSESETMDEREAEDTVEEILTQAALGIDEIDMKTKMRFNNWQIFNKALLFLYDALSPIRTNDVNYSFEI